MVVVGGQTTATRLLSRNPAVRREAEQEATAGDIVKAARMKRKQTGQSEISAIKELSGEVITTQQGGTGQDQPQVDPKQFAVKITDPTTGRTTTVTDLDPETAQAAAESIRERQRIEAVRTQAIQRQEGTGQTPQQIQPAGEAAPRNLTETIQRQEGEFRAGPEPEGVAAGISQRARELEFESQRTFGQPLRRQALAVGAVGLSAIGTAGFIITNPLEATKGLFQFGKQVITQPRVTAIQLFERAKTQPATLAGELIGSAAVFKGVSRAVKAQPVKLRSETIKIPLAETVKTPARTIKVKTLGLEVGSRSIPIRTRITPALPKGRKIKLQELAGPVAAATTRTGLKAQQKIFEVPKRQAQLPQIRIEEARITFREKGARRIPEISVEGIRDQPGFQRIVERRTAAARGEFRGTVTERSGLPKSFEKKVLGDIDITVPKGVKGTRRVGRLLEKDLLKLGENVEFRQKELAIFSRTTGAKIIELKAGKGPITADTVIGFGGFGFGVLRPVKIPSQFTIKVGRIGEQATAKAAGATFFRPATLEEATPLAFRGAGVLPKGTRFKDLIGETRTKAGIIELRKVLQPRATPVGRAIRQSRTLRLQELQRRRLGAFTPTQRKIIGEQVRLTTRGGVRIRVTPQKVSTRISAQLGRGKSRPLIPRATSPRSRAVSRRSNQIIKSVVSTKQSPSALPSLSPQKSILPSPLVSPRITSPSLSPRSLRSLRSPLLSPRSPRSPRSPTSRLPVITPFLFGPGRPRKTKASKRLDREFRFTPSLVAISENIKGIRPKDLTGLEIRPIQF